MLVQFEVPHIPLAPGQRRPYKEEHALNIATDPRFIQLLDSGFYQIGVVVRRLGYRLPIVVTFEVIKGYRCFSPVVITRCLRFWSACEPLGQPLRQPHLAQLQIEQLLLILQALFPDSLLVRRAIAPMFDSAAYSLEWIAHQINKVCKRALRLK